MSAVSTTRIVKIGNSQGVRIPKLLLQQSGLSGEVEVEAKANQLILRPVPSSAREGWEEKFQQMAARGDDALLDSETATTFDEGEWEW